MTSIHWDNFENLDPKEKGGEFEGLCYDLLTAMGFCVDRQSFSGKGGSDSGQDLILQQKDKETGALTPVCIVECKFRTSSTVGGADLWSPLLAVLELNVPSFLIITSSELTSPLKSRFRSICQNSRWGVTFRRIERTHLEALIQKYPDVLQKYFPTSEPIEVDQNLVEPIVADLKAASMIEKDGRRNVEVTLHNTTAKDKQVLVEISGQSQVTNLESFQELTLSLRVKPESNGECLSIKDTESSNQVAELQTKPSSVPISHIFVDPYDYVSKISDALRLGATVVISGRAGCGKSRIIYETVSNFDNSHAVDLSQDLGGIGLVGLLLEKIFKIPFREIRELPDNYITGFLAKETNISKSNLSALSAYIRQSKTDASGFAEAAARLCAIWFSGKLLAIDNIHRLTLFDLEFLQILSRHKKRMFLLLATRSSTEDFIESETLTFMDQQPGENWKKFVIDETNTSRLLETYIDRASKNEDTRKFLLPWKNVDSIQKFVLALKKLKAARVLEQDFSGRFNIFSLKGAHPNQQKEIFGEIKELVAQEISAKNVEKTIASAAIFGFQFPLSFVLESVGREGAEVIDRLEELEIVSSSDSIDGDLWFKFDHETTAELAKDSVRSIHARLLHEKVLEYLQDGIRYKSGQDDRRIAEHLEALGRNLESANKYHCHAVYDAKRGRYQDSLVTLDQAKKVVDEVVDISNEKRLSIELQIIHDFLNYSLIGSEAIDRRWQMLGAFKLALTLIGEEQQNRFKGRYWYFKAHLERDTHPDEAEKSTIESLSHFDIHNTRDRAESHALLSNLLKRRGEPRFSEALFHSRKALSLTRKCNDQTLRSRCLLHAGALFLEHGRARKTPWWWSKAVDCLAGSSDLGTLAFAQTDLAYINALTKPDSPDTRINLNMSRALAKQFDLVDIEIRSSINLANWTYFYDFDETTCLEFVGEAQMKIDIHKDPYKQSLLDFSCINFEKIHDHLDIQSREARLLEFLESSFSDRDKTIGGDRRVLNMLEYFARKLEPRVLQILSKAGDKSVEKTIREKENRNIYYFADCKAYVTYY